MKKTKFGKSLLEEAKREAYHVWSYGRNYQSPKHESWYQAAERRENERNKGQKNPQDSFFDDYRIAAEGCCSENECF